MQVVEESRPSELEGAPDAALAPNRARSRELARATRILSHVTVWLVLLVPAVIEMSRGWIPTGDDAAIAWQSFRTLSWNPPLLGQQATVAAGAHHVVSSPGPMQYWLLALPTHLDPLQGPLWGTALVCAIFLSLAVEALHRAGLWIACAGLALCVLNFAWLVPGVFVNSVWNPNMGLLLLFPATALAWVVAMGRFRWWPVLVVIASAAGQTELFYVVTGFSLVVASPVLGLLQAARPARWRWVPVGIGVGVLCWLPAVVQQMVANPGNLSLLFDARGTNRGSGLEFGFHALSFMVWPIPIWSNHMPYVSSLFQLSRTPLAIAFLVLVALVSSLAHALRSRDRARGGLVAVALVLCCDVVFSFALTPIRNLAAVSSFVPLVWLAGVAAWSSIGWTVIDVIRGRRRTMQQWLPQVKFVLVGFSAVIVSVVALVLPAKSIVDVAQVTRVNSAANAVVRDVPTGTMAFDAIAKTQRAEYLAAVHQLFTEGEGVAYQSYTEGRRPVLSALFTRYTGIESGRRPSRPEVILVLFDRGRRLAVVLNRHVGRALARDIAKSPQ